MHWLTTATDVLIAAVFVLFLAAAAIGLGGYVWSIGRDVGRIRRARRKP